MVMRNKPRPGTPSSVPTPNSNASTPAVDPLGWKDDAERRLYEGMTIVQLTGQIQRLQFEGIREAVDYSRSHNGQNVNTSDLPGNAHRQWLLNWMRNRITFGVHTEVSPVLSSTSLWGARGGGGALRVPGAGFKSDQEYLHYALMTINQLDQTVQALKLQVIPRDSPTYAKDEAHTQFLIRWLDHITNTTPEERIKAAKGFADRFIVANPTPVQILWWYKGGWVSDDDVLQEPESHLLPPATPIDPTTRLAYPSGRSVIDSFFSGLTPASTLTFRRHLWGMTNKAADVYWLATNGFSSAGSAIIDATGNAAFDALGAAVSDALDKIGWWITLAVGLFAIVQLKDLLK